MNIEENKKRFISLLQKGIEWRDGKFEAMALIEWLENETDFFVAPASTQHHGAVAGGLCAHSLAVHDAMQLVVNTFGVEGNFNHSMVALLHDLCKANFYKPGFRNVKNEKTGAWEKVPTYTIDDQLPLGHGEKSLYLATKFIDLTVDEAMAIRWHMGGYDDAGRGGWGGSSALSTAQKRYPLVSALHIADLAASFFDGV